MLNYLAVGAGRIVQTVGALREQVGKRLSAFINFAAAMDRGSRFDRRIICGRTRGLLGRVVARVNVNAVTVMNFPRISMKYPRPV